MTLRTPRRRISPQTKRRYRAIKGFFRRAIGSLSQPDLQITSSIAVNVTDIKHKILGLEQQLHEVSKQCCNIPATEISFRKDSLAPTELRDDLSNQNIPSKTQLKGVETKILYKTSDNHYKKSDDSNLVVNANNESGKTKSINKMNNFCEEPIPTLKKKKSKVERRYDNAVIPDFRKHKTKSEYENFISAYSTSSFHSFDQIKNLLRSKPGYLDCNEDKRDRNKGQSDRHKGKMYTKEHLKKTGPDNYNHHHEKDVETYAKTRIPKRNSRELDQDFIADIIRRQYKPMKMFGKKQSDLSQFSVPVCRDHEFRLTAKSYIQEDPQLTGCCCGGRHYARYGHYSDHSDLRSVCDARLYSVKRKSRIKHRKRYPESYNDSDIYDLIPVKEKSSPKSRRKFFEDNMARSAYYKEVPPSPKSHRPRLNLKAHYTGSDYNMDFVRNPIKRVSSRVSKRHQEDEDTEDNYYVPELRKMKKHQLLHSPSKGHDLADMQRDMGTMSSIQYGSFDAEENTATVETVLNKTQDTMSSADKTDKALCEIKDILQKFLQEIKKETSSHSAKSEISSKIAENYVNPSNDAKIGHSYNNYNSAQCSAAPPYMPPVTPFGNTCCYPMMPLCPMNCMHNNYAMPSASFTCNNCNNKSNETDLKQDTTKNETENDGSQCETDKLIQEIYKFVTQSPTFRRKSDNLAKGRSNIQKAGSNDDKVLTSRSAGGNTEVRRHDANVGTPKVNGVSKSCEAIGLKIVSDQSTNDTTASYSDTILEKLSQEATTTLSTSETDLTELTEADKAKRNKFTKILKSLGLYKKLKNDPIEELAESDSTVDVEVRKKPPFRQEIPNYMMYGQEYNKPPPISPHYRPEYPHDYRPPYNPDGPYVPEHIPTHPQPYHAHLEQRPTAPPYSNSFESYNQIPQPQVPLCLKEIEVKSIGCQSERKISFFRKITQKIQQPTETKRSDEVQKTCATQTKIVQNKPMAAGKLFNWKIPQPKKMDTQNNPYAFGYKTQRHLAEGDMKIRNAMLKKMFHKRNPFSPGNLILRTILGKDKSSYGEAPSMYRPRMFL